MDVDAVKGIGIDCDCSEAGARDYENYIENET